MLATQGARAAGHPYEASCLGRDGVGSGRGSKRARSLGAGGAASQEPRAGPGGRRGRAALMGWCRAGCTRVERLGLRRPPAYPRRSRQGAGLLAACGPPHHIRWHPDRRVVLHISHLKNTGTVLGPHRVELSTRKTACFPWQPLSCPFKREEMPPSASRLPRRSRVSFILLLIFN